MLRLLIKRLLPVGLFLLVMTFPALAQDGSGAGIDFQLSLGEPGEDTDVGVAIQLVVLMTILSLAPAIILMMTSFLRIIIVLGFVRNAMGLQSTPPNQALVGIALFLSFFLMMPVGTRIHEEALQPLEAGEITSMEALDRAVVPLREFMLRQTRPGDIDYFMGIAGLPQMTPDELPMRVVIPSFVISELRTAFQMGFLIFLPFLVVDFIIATVLMAMGMMMMPPVIVSLPFKVLLFVLADGWYLIVQSLVSSF
ncbi:MAG: flagellar type III secretion system pore protein FliP [Puniceicoccaceae bacterium]